MQEEIKALNENNTYTIVPTPPGQHILSGKWVYRIKTDVNGLPTRYKARWVVRGFEQIQGIDFFLTYASVARISTIRLLLALSVQFDWHIHQLDVVTAYLNGDIDSTVYIRLPTGFTKPGSSAKLNKSLYGLKQSPRLWQLKLQSILKEIQLHPLHSDPSVYTNTSKSIFLVTYVDDLLIFGKDLPEIQTFKTQISNILKVKDLGPCHHFLGLRIERDRSKHTLSLVQDAYISKLLKAYNFNNSTPSGTPLNDGAVQDLLPNPDTATPEQINNYQQAIGALLYLSTQTRPDLSFTLSFLARFSSNPSSTHWKHLTRVFRYLAATKNLKLTFYKNAKLPVLNLHAFSDSDWANCPSTRRSQQGYIIYASQGPISWLSTRQPTVSTSSTEAEYISLFEASRESIFIQRLLLELGYQGPDLRPFAISSDNQSAITIAFGHTDHKRRKHIDTKYHWIQERINNFTIKWIPSKTNPADGLTKPLPTALHRTFINQLGLLPASTK
jgi:hypothetical protein